MVKLSDVAKAAGVSVSTVSYVLNGKGGQRRISGETQENIREVARKLNYNPDIQAKRLKSKKNVLPVFAVLWDSSNVSGFIGRFMQGVQTSLIDAEQEYELIILPYRMGELHKVKALTTHGIYNGAIIANASKRDLAFLEHADIALPVVLFNRISERFPCIYMDENKIGQMAAEYMIRNGHRKLALVVPELDISILSRRLSGFMEICKKYDIAITEKQIQVSDYSVKGGEIAAEMLMRGFPDLDGLYYMADIMAVGGINYLSRMNYRIPEDVAVMSHGNNIYASCSNPAMTVTDLCVEEMSINCVNYMVNEYYGTRNTETVCETEPVLVCRESC